MPYRNKKIPASAKGESCTLKSPWCNNNPETTVFAHLNESFAGKGMGQKADDYAGFYACSKCHDIYDRRDNVTGDWKLHEDWMVLRAMSWTLKRLFEKGVIK